MKTIKVTHYHCDFDYDDLWALEKSEAGEACVRNLQNDSAWVLCHRVMEGIEITNKPFFSDECLATLLCWTPSKLRRIKKILNAQPWFNILTYTVPDTPETREHYLNNDVEAYLEKLNALVET